MENKQIDKSFLENGARSIHEDDIRKAVENEEKLNEKVKKSRSLKAYFKELTLLFSLVKDYWKGNYRSIEYKAIATVVFTLLYVLSTLNPNPDLT